jgi:hypothetical protein
VIHKNSKSCQLFRFKSAANMNYIVIAAIALCAFSQTALAQNCPGQLLINGDFEEPNTMLVPTDYRDQYSNSRWGWYLKVPGKSNHEVTSSCRRSAACCSWPAQLALCASKAGTQHAKMVYHAPGLTGCRRKCEHLLLPQCHLLP